MGNKVLIFEIYLFFLGLSMSIFQKHRKHPNGILETYTL